MKMGALPYNLPCPSARYAKTTKGLRNSDRYQTHCTIYSTWWSVGSIRTRMTRIWIANYRFDCCQIRALFYANPAAISPSARAQHIAGLRTIVTIHRLTKNTTTSHWARNTGNTVATWTIGHTTHRQIPVFVSMYRSLNTTQLGVNSNNGP